ncbi:unnamed protein product [Schistocephalus solidus]|uniref:Uncharacterized protein n=1 Tax=Schistocephalus solidus TaxID=70667 RepID=A0A3P7DDT0_SCHSO|nr:unnamed protein product [Schistocephalus solidus]
MEFVKLLLPPLKDLSLIRTNWAFFLYTDAEESTNMTKLLTSQSILKDVHLAEGEKPRNRAQRARGSMVERSTQKPKVAGSNPRCSTLGIGYDWLMMANKPEMAIPVSLVFVGSTLSTYATRRYATAFEGSSLSSRAQRNIHVP